MEGRNSNDITTLPDFETADPIEKSEHVNCNDSEETVDVDVEERLETEAEHEVSFHYEMEEPHELSMVTTDDDSDSDGMMWASSSTPDSEGNEESREHALQYLGCQSSNKVIQNIFLDHLVPFLEEHRSPPDDSMKRFLSEYLTSFVEPTGWIAEWWKPDYENYRPLYEWPRPKILAGLVQVESVQLETLTVSGKFIKRGLVTRGDKRGDIQMVPGEEVEEVINLPIHQLVPLKPTMAASILNLRTLKNGLEGLRLLLDHLICPGYLDLSAELFFKGELGRVEDLFYDLEVHGSLSNKMRQNIIELLCTFHYYSQDLAKYGDPDTDDEALEILKVNHILSRTHNEITSLLIPEVRKGSLSFDEKTNSEISDTLPDSKVIMVSFQNKFQFAEISLVKSILTDRQEEFKIKDINELSFSNNLVNTLQNCKPNSVVFVLAGDYEIPSMGAIALGGFIIGLPDGKGRRPKIKTHGTGDVWNVISTDDTACTIENVDLEVGDGYAELVLTSMFVITKGCLTLTKCTLESTQFKKSTSSAGVYQQFSMIDVRDDTTVKMTDCVVKGSRCVFKQEAIPSPLKVFMKTCIVENVMNFLDVQGSHVSLDLEDLQFVNTFNNMSCLDWDSASESSPQNEINTTSLHTSLKRQIIERNHKEIANEDKLQVPN